MGVTVVNETRSRIDSALVRRSIEAALAYCKIKGTVSVAFIGDQKMRRLNKTYRGKDKVTDILSFTEGERRMDTWPAQAGENYLGDLFIDYQVIKRQAKLYAPSIRWELAFIAIHGALHLLGYEDESARGAAEMERLGHVIIKKVI